MSLYSHTNIFNRELGKLSPQIEAQFTTAVILEELFKENIELISLKEACKRFDVSRPWLYKVDEKDKIFVKIHGRTFVNVEKFKRLSLRDN